jgi:hypothetical protein
VNASIISSSWVRLIYVEFCEITRAITTKSEHTDHWTKMLRPFALFSGSVPSRHIRSSAGFTITTCVFEFSVHTAKAQLFDTGSWGAFCDVTLTLKQGHQSDRGSWIKIDAYACRQAFRHFMNLLNRAVYGAAFRRYRRRLRVLSVLEKGEVRGNALCPWERGTSGRWHIHCAIELAAHLVTALVRCRVLLPSTR